ncbi:MAG: ATP-binding protein [Oligoflexales bacterium]
MGTRAIKFAYQKGTIKNSSRLKEFFSFGFVKTKIYWKLYLTNSFLLITILTLVIVAILSKFEELLWHNRFTHLKEKITMIIPQATASLKSNKEGPIQDLITQIGENTATRITIIRSNGRVVADSHEPIADLATNHWHRPEIQEALDSSYGDALRLSDSLDTKMFYLAKKIEADGDVLGVVRLSIPMSMFQKQIKDLNLVILWICFFGIVIMLMSSYHLIHKITRPITELMSICNAMVLGDYSKKVKSPGPDEIGRLGYTLNRLSDEISGKIATISMERAQLKSMLTAMTEGIVSVDSNDKILFCNHTACIFLDGNYSSGHEKPISETIGFKILTPILIEARKKKSSVVEEITLSKSSGEKILNLHASPFQLRNDFGVVVVIHDMTRIRHLEKVRQDFVANVSHEIKTPLTSINGYVETLLEGAIYDERYNSRFLKKVQSNTNRLIFLVKDILSLATIESDNLELNFENKKWGPIIEQVITQYEQVFADKELSLEYDPKHSITVQGDEECMRQILDNLVSNALRYTQAGGKISILLSTQSVYGVLSISDTGIGIPQKDIERVFERFYRVDKDRSRELGGTGLGLSIVKHMVSSMQGSVTVESEVGNGSTFSVFLPLAKEHFC